MPINLGNIKVDDFKLPGLPTFYRVEGYKMVKVTDSVLKDCLIVTFTERGFPITGLFTISFDHTKWVYVGELNETPRRQLPYVTLKCCKEPNIRGGHCTNCDTWINDALDNSIAVEAKE